jgi:chemotaxis methyl-accepting protein methylase
MLCAEAAAAAGHAAWTERVRITATDIDRESLERARNAVYPQASFLEAPAWITEKYCERAGESWRVREDIRRMVTITRLDLTRESIPTAAYDLIFCRNVVIYFDRPMQERLFAQFAEALQPGGILVLGKVETLLGVAREKLTLVDARERIFRRAA